MGMTMTQKILARAAGVERCRAGELLMCKLDLVLGNDITAPVAINEFHRMGAVKVFDPAKIALIPDHFVPNKDIKAATLAKQMREFARAQHIVHYYEVGRVGIEHALLPEQGIVAPARSSSVRTATPAPTARWARSPRAWARRIWPWAWRRANAGSRCRRPSRSC